jgi:methionine synthase II (cobalamin-independent)
MIMFTTTQVGSWPRSKKMLKALRDNRVGKMSREDFNRIADDEVRRTVRIQEEAGLDIVVDGEHRRDSFYSFITDKVEGTKLMSLAEMLDEVEDKSGFEEMLDTLDVPASAIRNPTCVGRLERREPLALNDFLFVKTLTRKRVKITLPGPYLLSRSMWVSGYTKKVYKDQFEMGDDIVRILRQELQELADAGCEFVQFDEPVLTEIVMSQECGRRTFM